MAGSGSKSKQQQQQQQQQTTTKHVLIVARKTLSHKHWIASAYEITEPSGERRLLGHRLGGTELAAREALKEHLARAEEASCDEQH